MNKQQIAEILEETATLLELKGANSFRIRAYRNAARSLLKSTQPLQKMIREKTLDKLEGIGKELAEKITTLAQKHRLPFYEKLKKSAPKGLQKLLKVHGLGPKKVQTLYRDLKIQSITALKKACEKGNLSKIKGFGKKTEDKLLSAIGAYQTYRKRFLYPIALKIAEDLLKGLKKHRSVKKAAIAGSLRRALETAGDIDLVCVTLSPKPVVEWLTKHPQTQEILLEGKTKASIRTKEGIQVDLRLVKPKEFASCLLYSTGSKEHNLKLRERAQKKGYRLNEYGLIQGKKKGTFETEKALYQALGLSFIPPELRENRGELLAAFNKELPKLVQLKDIKGAFHNHTIASDGTNTLLEMADYAKTLGWEYLGIAEHSKSNIQANGLKEKALYEQIEQIQKLNQHRSKRPYLFSGVECDILPDGSLDLPDDLLKEFDYVIISVHSAFSQDEKRMTRRLIKAIEHPLTTMVGHLTGRLLLKREPYSLNIPKILDTCMAHQTIVELNAQPSRLDLDWRHLKTAKEKGLLCSINSDAHSKEELHYIKQGVLIARKGWLEPSDIINTWPLEKILTLFSR